MKTNNERGEILIIGIDDLSDVLKKIGGAEIYVDNRFYKVLDATPKGLVGEKGLLSSWRDLDDRHTERDGIFFEINDKDYFYFKLTDKEREDNPYSFWAEKRADMEDAFRDAGEDGDMIPYLNETLKIRKIIREALSESVALKQGDTIKLTGKGAGSVTGSEGRKRLSPEEMKKAIEKANAERKGENESESDENEKKQTPPNLPKRPSLPKPPPIPPKNKPKRVMPSTPPPLPNKGSVTESVLPDEDDDEEIRVCADCGEEIESDTFVGDEGWSICPECGSVENTTYITRGEQKRREERMKRKGLDENKLIIRNLIRKSLKNNSL